MKRTAIYAHVMKTSARLSWKEEPIGTVHLNARARAESVSAVGSLYRRAEVRILVAECTLFLPAYR